MYFISANNNGITTLGYAGENDSRAVIFDYPKEWIDEYPDGELKVHVKRAGDGAIYTATEIFDDRESLTLTWTITENETSFDGVGEAQLCLIDNGVIVKSQRYATAVNQSTAAVTPTDPPPDTIIEQAVEDYLRDYVDVITISSHGEDGQILQSNGDGSYSWLSVDNEVIDSDSGDTLVPTRTLNRLARIIRQKTGYEGDMTVETMAEVLEQTDMWTTEEYCMNLAPAAAELTITLGALSQYALFSRQNISKIILPYCGTIEASAFQASSVSSVVAPNVSKISSNTFYNASGLAEIHFPKIVTIIGANAFYNCGSLRSVDFPKLIYISAGTFSGCYSLVVCALPELYSAVNQATGIDSVFQGCNALSDIELPKYAWVFRNSWFDGCWVLKEAVFPKLTQITGNYNFRNCYSLEKVYAPECTVWNGTQNFLNCNSLQRMCFYVKPTTISNTLFSGAPVLQDIYVSWSQGEVAGAPWGAPAGCTVHYDTTYDEDGEPIV